MRKSSEVCQTKMCDWLSLLQKAKKSCLVERNLKKVHYELENGSELVEEYNTDTEVLTRRAWRQKTKLGAEGNWQIEIGDPEPSLVKSETIIREDANQPFVSRRNTKKSLEWRIRNLPYPENVYSVSADNEERCLVVRTSNKKYFKKLIIPELDRLNLTLDQKNVSFQHKFNTLIISYEKPDELNDFEAKVYDEVKKLKPKDYGDVNNCKPS